MRHSHYLNVITAGPLIIVRTPWPVPRPWGNLLKALGSVMHAHGYRKKDIVDVEGMAYFAPDATAAEKAWHPKTAAKDEVLLERLDAAFAGDPEILPKFWLYDWQNGDFVLVRPRTG